MAWRVQDSVVRGEVDNRQQGTVRGRVWLKGLAEPIVLELQGNAAPDLAGCLLTFENPSEAVRMRPDASLAPQQVGTVGDLTASRKVRVLDMPVTEAYERLKKDLPVPEHIANSLYLEWFSDANGRVVIESAEYKLTISTPAWRPTPDQEAQREQEAASGFSRFLQKLDEALAGKKHEPPENKEWDEFDYEKFMRECDARTDKYGELLDKYMDDPDRDRIIAREMGWTWLEEALDAEAGAGLDLEEGKGAGLEGQEAGRDLDPNVEGAADLAPDPATEGIDWVRDKEGYIHHPLALRTLEGSLALRAKLDELGLEKSEDEDLSALACEYQITSAKLAGALGSLAYDRGLQEGAFIVAYLKRALVHLHASQAALEKVASKRLLPAEMLTGLRTEFFSVREQILRLMQEFRGKK
jgi:hypothetical protein